MRGVARFVLALALGAQAGCGFQLAGNRPLPDVLSSVYVDVVTPYSVKKPPLEAALTAQLLRRGARISGSESGARAILRITDLTERQDVLSVDPFGKAVEYKLTTSVHYELMQDGKPAVPPGELQVSRDYSFNAQQVLAKEAEALRLQSFMQDELAELLLLRLEALLTAPPVAAPPVASGVAPG